MITQLDNLFGNHLKVNNRGEIRYNCPFCKKYKGIDTHYHLYVNIDKGKYYCQKCKASGELSYLLKSHGIISPTKTYLAEYKDKLLSESLFSSSEDIKEVEFYIPELIDIYPETPAYDYLINRGVTKEDIDYYGLKLIISPGAYMNRIFLPEYREGELIYWAARYAGKKNPTYLNVPKIDGNNKIFNFDTIPNNNPILVCEGPISAILAGHNAVATYSKNFRIEQVDLLLTKDPSEIIICYDGDAIKDSLKLCKEFKVRGYNNLSIVLMNYFKDPADYNKMQFNNKLKSRKPLRSITDELEVRLMSNLTID